MRGDKRWQEVTLTKLSITRFILYQFSWHNSFVINWGHLKWCGSLVWVEFICRANLIKYLDWHIIWDGDVVCPSGGAAARRQRRPALLPMLPSHHVGTHTVYRQPQQQPLYDSEVYTPKQSYRFCKNQKTAFNSFFRGAVWLTAHGAQLVAELLSFSLHFSLYISLCIRALLRANVSVSHYMSSLIPEYSSSFQRICH